MCSVHTVVLGNCTRGELVDPIHRGQCIQCPFDTYQPEVEPGTTTRWQQCPEHMGTRQRGSVSKADCLRRWKSQRTL